MNYKARLMLYRGVLSLKPELLLSRPWLDHHGNLCVTPHLLRRRLRSESLPDDILYKRSHSLLCECVLHASCATHVSNVKAVCLQHHKLRESHFGFTATYTHSAGEAENLFASDYINTLNIFHTSKEG